MKVFFNGNIASEWRNDDGAFMLTFDVPVSIVSTVTHPSAKTKTYGSRSNTLSKNYEEELL